LGRRRRRVIRIVKKKLPTVFVCPRCGEEAVRVTIAKDTGHATVLCALCNLKDDFPAHPAAQPIDVYSYFTDRFYGVKDPRAIIPREREILQAPVDEPEEKEATTGPSIEDMTPPPSPTMTETNAQASSREADLQPSPSPPVVESADPTPTVAEELKTEAEPQSEEKESEEEAEPFADILENKDKKRYSSQPLPQQSNEQTS
jgi:transcription elongation factor Elf1